MTDVHLPASPGPRVAGREVLLKVRDLHTEFATDGAPVVAVDSVNFDLRRGERLGVVGESGSGKSALARSLLGLISSPGKIVGGSVDLDGTELRELSERGWRRIRGRKVALIFQDPMGGFDPIRTVGNQLVEAVLLHQNVSRSTAREMVLERLVEVEIKNPERAFDYYPHQFSGGMLQRAAIAMALLNDPILIIADEPTTALDVTTQATVLALIRRLSDEHGAALILISHDLGVVAQTCDTVQVMYAGRIVERGPAVEVLSHPRHPYTAALLRSIVRRDRPISGALPSIPGSPPDLRMLGPGCAFEPRCPVGQGNPFCQSTLPVAHSFTAPAGSVTVKCHFPLDSADVVVADVTPSGSAEVSGR